MSKILSLILENIFKLLVYLDHVLTELDSIEYFFSKFHLSLGNPSKNDLGASPASLPDTPKRRNFLKNQILFKDVFKREAVPSKRLLHLIDFKSFGTI